MVELKVADLGLIILGFRGVDRGATHTRGSRLTSNEFLALPSSLICCPGLWYPVSSPVSGIVMANI